MAQNIGKTKRVSNEEFKKFDTDLGNVLSPFIEFINKYPHVFQLKFSDTTQKYSLHIDLPLLEQQLGEASQVAL